MAYMASKCNTSLDLKISLFIYKLIKRGKKAFFKMFFIVNAVVL